MTTNTTNTLQEEPKEHSPAPEASRYALPKRDPLTRNQFKNLMAVSAMAYPIVMLGMVVLASEITALRWLVYALCAVVFCSLAVVNFQLQRQFFKGAAAYAMTALYMVAPSMMTAYVVTAHSKIASTTFHPYFQNGGIYVIASCFLIPVIATALHFVVEDKTAKK